MRAAIIASAIVLGACGSDDSDSGAPPTLTELKEQVFAKSCQFNACHVGVNGAGGMSFDGDSHAIYKVLVGVASPNAKGRTRVVAGDPDASYIIEKLTAAKPAAGMQMPPGEPIAASRIDMIRRWIAAGALDD